jgi:sacsin
LTEVPQFVSGRHVVWFDPHATSLPGVNPANPGKMVDFRKNSALVQKYPDQFAPLEVR